MEYEAFSEDHSSENITAPRGGWFNMFYPFGHAASRYKVVTTKETKRMNLSPPYPHMAISRREAEMYSRNVAKL